MYFLENNKKERERKEEGREYKKIKRKGNAIKLQRNIAIAFNKNLKTGKAQKRRKKQKH